jgi:hypothetical protein
MCWNWDVADQVILLLCVRGTGSRLATMFALSCPPGQLLSQ